MTQFEVSQNVTPLITQALAGAANENPKLDFKREWYKLDTPDGIADFLCDTSAMANTFGLDGFIIIGLDEKNCSLLDSPISNANYRPDNFMNLISKYVDQVFTLNIFEILLEGKRLSVLHIPPSINKPHVIRSFTKKGKVHEQRIFLRKDRQNQKATKYDLELMYYDRKNIIPEYHILSSFNSNAITFTTVNTTFVECLISVDFENIGRRPVSISEVRLALTHSYVPHDEDILNLRSSNVYVHNCIVVQPGQLQSKQILFTSYDMACANYQDLVQKIKDHIRYLQTKRLLIFSSNGNQIESELKLSNFAINSK